MPREAPTNRNCPFDVAASNRSMPEADDFALAWIGQRTSTTERRQVVVLASGFTQTAEAYDGADPEELADALARRASVLSHIVNRHGGSVLAVQLERYVACWGWPTCRDDDGRRAVAAALEIVDRLAGDGARCGLDAGIAVAGPDQLAGPAGGSVVGEVVRSASMLQAMAPPARVVVSAALQSLVGAAFEAVPLGGEFAGLSEHLRPATVTGAIADRPRHGAAADGNWIGRESEFAFVLDCWRRVGDGALQCIHLEGEAGVGKTAMLVMLKEHLAAAGIVVIESQCQQETASIELAPMQQLADDLVDRSGNEAPWKGGAEVVSGRATPGTAAVGRLEMCDLVLGLIEHVGAAMPMAILIDDLHWADEATRTCLAALSARLPRSGRVLVLATSRAALPAELAEAGCWATRKLGRLSQASIERILLSSPFIDALSKPTRALIAELAEGIPHYALELASMQAELPGRVCDHRILARPNRINGGIAGRLDALGSLKPLAQCAAVLGRRFDPKLLAILLEMDVDTLRARLDMLVARGIMVNADAELAGYYRFTHALLWSVANGTMLKSRRRRMHARAADELIARFPEVATNTPEIIAHHFSKAGNPARAFTWWREAAYAAARTGRMASAVAHINQALAAKTEAPAACTPLQEAELMSLLGAQIGALSGSASVEGESAYRRAMSLLSQLPGRPADLGFDVQWGITAVHMVRGEIGPALAASAVLIEIARENDRDDLLLVATRVHGTAKLLSGRVHEATELLSWVVRHYDPVRHAQLRFRYVSDQGIVGCAHLAWVTAIAGDEAASRAAQRRALTMSGELGHSHTSASVLGTLATAAQIRADLSAASAFSHACNEISNEHGYEYWAARGSLVMSWVKAQTDPGEGLVMIADAAQRYRRTGSGRAVSYSDYLEAEIACAAGQPRRALAALERAQLAGNLQSGRIYAAEFQRLRALATFECHAGRDAAEAGSAGRSDFGAGVGPREAADTLLAAAHELATAQGAKAFADRAALARANLNRRRRKPHLRFAVTSDR